MVATGGVCMHALNHLVKGILNPKLPSHRPGAAAKREILGVFEYGFRKTAALEIAGIQIFCGVVT